MSPRSPPSRRRLLGALGVAGTGALAGCAGSLFGTDCPAGASFSMAPATDENVVGAVATSVADLPPVGADVVARALDADDGRATHTGYYEPSVHASYVVQDGGYYRATVEAGDHADATGYRYRVRFGDDVPTPDEDADVVDFADLPASDRESFYGAVGRSVEKLKGASGGEFDVVFVAREGDDSRFVPESDATYVRWEGTTFRFTFAETRTVQVVTYAVRTGHVTDSTDEFVGMVLDDRGLVLDSLSAEQRDVVEEAIGEGYRECEPYSDPFEALLGRLSTGEYEFVPFVNYAGDWYDADVSKWMA